MIMLVPISGPPLEPQINIYLNQRFILARFVVEDRLWIIAGW
jgi:hypothetical protein